MPPNFNEGPASLHTAEASKKPDPPGLSGNTWFLALRSLITLVAHVIIGILTGVAFLFSFRAGVPSTNATNQHVILCVIGYQLLMAQAILCLSPDSWSAKLNLKHKRWMHTFLQVLGSVLALAGSFIKILDKDIHWNTLHGQTALVAMVFTSVSLVNGVTSLYAYQFRRFKIPPTLSKLTHICFGIVSMVFASIALITGFDKGFFRLWADTSVTDGLIVMTIIFTIIVIVNPGINFISKSINVVRN